jgi:hypothetical protein
MLKIQSENESETMRMVWNDLCLILEFKCESTFPKSTMAPNTKFLSLIFKFIVQ